MLGWTFVEVIYVLAIFGVFLWMLTTMTEELRRQELRHPIDFMQHPQITAVMSRLRRDVLDAFGDNPYPPTFDNYVQTPETLIIYSIISSGAGQTIVWDFRISGEARRIAHAGGLLISDWKTRGVPNFKISTFDIPGGRYAVRIRALNRKGKLAIDQVFVPRAH